MAHIPREPGLDSTLALLADGYTFLSKRCQRHGSDIFETRLMLQKAVCIMGQEAAEARSSLRARGLGAAGYLRHQP